jgi:hypothetical protein
MIRVMTTFTATIKHTTQQGNDDKGGNDAQNDNTNDAGSTP